MQKPFWSLAQLIYIKSTQKKDKDLYQLFNDDIANIKAGKTNLRNLICHSNAPILNQQSKRSIAHLGLLIFNKLIRKNEGLIIASSYNLKTEREWVLEPEIIVSQNILGAASGTRISFVLPVFPHKTYKPHLSHSLVLPATTTAVEKKGLEAILQVLPVDDDLLPESSPDKIRLLSYIQPSVLIANRGDEEKMWLALENRLRQAEQDLAPSSRLLFNINLNLCEINHSQLFRLLGRIETEFPKHTTLVSNIRHELFLDLYELNKLFVDFLEEFKLPFWSDQNVTLIYHYLELEKNHRFYFTDGLWGSKETDNFRLNKLIQRNHFNATSHLFKPNNGSSHEPKLKINLDHSPAFYNENVLLPLDLLLPGGDDQTIFEHNANVLLNNPIKPNSPYEI